jgi:hypothetical protein
VRPVSTSKYDFKLRSLVAEPSVNHGIAFDIETRRDRDRVRSDVDVEALQSQRAVATRPEPNDLRLKPHGLAVAVTARVRDDEIHANGERQKVGGGYQPRKTSLQIAQSASGAHTYCYRGVPGGLTPDFLTLS